MTVQENAWPDSLVLECVQTECVQACAVRKIMERMSEVISDQFASIRDKEREKIDLMWKV